MEEEILERARERATKQAQLAAIYLELTGASMGSTHAPYRLANAPVEKLRLAGVAVLRRDGHLDVEEWTAELDTFLPLPEPDWRSKPGLRGRPCPNCWRIHGACRCS